MNLRSACAFLLSCAIWSACSGAPVSGVELEGKVRQASHLDFTPWTRRLLLVVVVDDAPTEDARRMREYVAEQFVGWIDDLRKDSCHMGWDFAVDFPVDIRVLLVPSSSPELALHSGNTPGLDMFASNPSSERNADWEMAAAEALLTLESPEVLPNRLFDALAYWNDLLSGTTEPANVEDIEWVGRQPSDIVVLSSLVTTRDDESRLEFRHPTFGSVNSAAPEGFWRTEEGCPEIVADEHVPRLADALGIISACEFRVLDDGAACDVHPVCMGGSPLALDDGEVSCRVLAYLDINESCPMEAGWDNPTTAGGNRVPTLAQGPLDGPGEESRVCEILQLTGQAARSCVEDFECTECEPGWCWRNPFPEHGDTQNRYCAADGGSDWAQIRVVGGALSARTGTLEYTCDLQ